DELVLEAVRVDGLDSVGSRVADAVPVVGRTSRPGVAGGRRCDDLVEGEVGWGRGLDPREIRKLRAQRADALLRVELRALLGGGSCVRRGEFRSARLRLVGFLDLTEVGALGKRSVEIRELLGADPRGSAGEETRGSDAKGR